MKRILSSMLLLPITVLIIVIDNIYVLDVATTIIALVSLYEFYKAFSVKYKLAKWVGYLSTIIILLQHLFVNNSLFNVFVLTIFVSFLLTFFEVFIKKINVIEACITLLGIFYITLFTFFVPLIKELNNGQFLIWYIFVATWGTDVFALAVGRTIGKHKLIAISPKKTVEGSIGGIIGAVALVALATYIFNTCFEMNYSYLFTSIIAVALSVVSQIGDLIASSVKRYCEIKDYSNLIPGHGGMLDRFDSVIFSAPLAYILLAMLV